MIPLTFSATLLVILTVLIFLGLGQKIIKGMRLTNNSALIIILTMILGHFLPTINLNTHFALNLGALGPIFVVVYLLTTTSKFERIRALLVSVLVFLLVFLTDKILPLDPGLLDPVFSAGIFSGFLAYFWGRSRRSAFIAGILGILITDLVNQLELWLIGIPQQTIIGSGGLFSSMIISPFIAVLIAEIMGETRERLHAVLGGENHE